MAYFRLIQKFSENSKWGAPIRRRRKIRELHGENFSRALGVTHCKVIKVDRQSQLPIKINVNCFLLSILDVLGVIMGNWLIVGVLGVIVGRLSGTLIEYGDVQESPY